MVNVGILASSVPFTLTKVQVPNLALTNTKWITLQIEVSDPYIYYIHVYAKFLLIAQGTHQSLMRMLSICFEGTALLKIRLSIRVRNFAATNESLNIFYIFLF
jgi:hypothetical protein